MIRRGGARAFAALALSLAALACDSSRSPRPAPSGPSSAAAASASAARAAASAPAAPGVGKEFAFFEVVTGGAAIGERLPLVVALHGMGDTPEAFIGLFQGFPAKARVVAPRTETHHREGYSWFDFKRGDFGFSTAGIAARADQLTTWMVAFSGTRPTLGKPIVTGFSQGGALSFAIAARHPEAISAAIPLGGWLEPGALPASKPAETVPVFALHGAADPLVPPEKPRSAVELLTERGYAASVRLFEGVPHAIPPEERAALFEVLGARCRAASGAPEKPATKP